MRKLVYVGYNKELDEAIETTSYELMNEYKAKGFKFKTRLDDILKKRVPLAEWKKRKAETDSAIRAKRALNAVMAGV